VGNIPSIVVTSGGPLATASPGLSLIIPAWNEEARLPRTLARYLPSLEARGLPFEIVVVTDGVDDRTAEVASAMASPHVRVLRFPQRLGKGGAIMRGVSVARYDYVGYLDADGPISPEDLFAMVAKLSDADCVLASRRLPESRILNQEPPLRRLVGNIWSALVRSLMLLPVRDTQCGAKVFRRSSIVLALRAVRIQNWAFDVSLLYHLSSEGATIREYPVSWSHDPDSRLAMASVVPVMFASLMGLRLMNLGLSRFLPATWFDRFAPRPAAD
jgi:glycosyltransferase involved in cell wall biosynthesis